MEKELVVSIGVTAYNQEKYIKKNLDSLLMQKTNFKYEILINDDASTDNTAKIIKEYEEKYPDIIKPLYQKENQFSKNLGISKNFIFPRIKGKYFAICEGDDYWTDVNKLQKQVDFLEANPEFIGCYHPVKVIYENSNKKDEIFPTKKMLAGKKYITLNDLLDRNYIQTNSVIYRWPFHNIDTEEYFPENILPGDHYLHLVMAQKGNIAILTDIMAVYRKNEQGIWYNAQNNIEQLHLKHGLKEINFKYNVYKNITNSSKDYLERKFLPTMRYIMDIYYKHKKYFELQEINKQYPEIYDQIFDKLGIYKPSTEQKLNKYKIISKFSIILFFTSFIINILLILYICTKI